MEVFADSQNLYKKFDRLGWSKHTNQGIASSEKDAIQLLKIIGKGKLINAAENVFLELCEFVDARIRSSEETTAPFIIGVAGSVASGKSTFSSKLKELLERPFRGLLVDIVSTDGFLFPNSYLASNNLMERKGFPESYNIKSLIKFLSEVKKGKPEVLAPIYSHLLYDVISSEKTKVKNPDVLILEGINVLQKNHGSDKNNLEQASDFFDFSIYIDAEEEYLRDWFTSRFFLLRREASKDKKAYLHKLAALSDDETKSIAKTIWENINLKNLNENILPTRERADLVIKKNKDHKINEIWLRNI